VSLPSSARTVEPGAWTTGLERASTIGAASGLPLCRSTNNASTDVGALSWARVDTPSAKRSSTIRPWQPYPRCRIWPPGRREHEKSPAVRGFSLCAREDSNFHGPFGPQGPQPCTRRVDALSSVQIVQIVGFAARIGRDGKGGCCHECCHACPVRRGAQAGSRVDRVHLPKPARPRCSYGPRCCENRADTLCATPGRADLDGPVRSAHL
jgi:hypothetical protein